MRLRHAVGALDELWLAGFVLGLVLAAGSGTGAREQNLSCEGWMSHHFWTTLAGVDAVDGRGPDDAEAAKWCEDSAIFTHLTWAEARIETCDGTDPDSPRRHVLLSPREVP